jgi:hypothetical protein
MDTPRGPEVIGVLVACCGSLWRARIVTYPDTLWTVPGGGGSMKFAAASPQAAERQAIAFIKSQCIERRWMRREDTARVSLGAVDPERAPDAQPPSPARRKLRSFPVWFGLSVPTIEAVTVDLSATGLSVASHTVFEAGTQLQLRLDLYAFRVTCRGKVAWSCSPAEAGRPAGMGIRLIDPPAIYVRYVEALR